MKMSADYSRIVFIFVVYISWCTSNDFEQTKRYAIKLNKTYKEKIIQILNANGFTLLYEITPETHIVEYDNKDRGSRILRQLSGLHHNQIISWEPVRIYDNNLKPASDNAPIQSSNQSIIVCENYYGMHVEDVWLLGYTGKGVKIAVNDVGINVDLLDLKNTIETSLSFNFIKQTMNVTPEDFINMSSEAVERTDHGNRVASVVAAEKDNNICNAGIAFNATLVPLKIFEVDPRSGQRTRADIVGQSFVYKSNDIDIFVNAWRPTEKFDPLDLSSVEALKHGATTGRNGLGTIYLVPAGTPGNLLSNNIYTITVGGMGRFGSVPSDADVDASVITSGLSVGNNITARTMVTASKNNKCITSFNGTSLATAQIAGIIAMGLEANRHLSQRDILHLLVKSSERTGLKEANEFRQNGAGLYVHNIFGFGLLNAMRFVQLAEHGVSTPKLETTELLLNKRSLSDTLAELSFCFQCTDITSDKCITYIEYVEVYFKLSTNTGILKINVTSPSNTFSLLMDDTIGKHGSMSTIEGKFVSAQFWDEFPFGNWKVKIQHYLQNHTTFVDDAKITLYGIHVVDSVRFKHINRCEENITLILEDKKTTSKQPNKILKTLEKEGLSSSDLVIIIISITVAVVLIVTCIVCLKRHCFKRPFREGPLRQQATHQTHISANQSQARNIVNNPQEGVPLMEQLDSDIPQQLPLPSLVTHLKKITDNESDADTLV